MSSVLPPELIHMVMSYLSDEEKMRLIRIDPGTFDVLTSDERFKAEFMSRGFHTLSCYDNSDDFYGMEYRITTNNPTEMIEYLFNTVILDGCVYLLNESHYDSVEISSEKLSFTQLENLNLLKAWIKPNAKDLDSSIKGSTNTKIYFNHRARERYFSLNDPEELELTNVFVKKLTEMMKDCYAGATIYQIEDITTNILKIVHFHHANTLTMLDIFKTGIYDGTIE